MKQLHLSPSPLVAVVNYAEVANVVAVAVISLLTIVNDHKMLQLHLSVILQLSTMLHLPLSMLLQMKLSVTAKLISAFVFATSIVQCLFYLNPIFQASSHLLWVYSLVCVSSGRKQRRPVFSQRGSIDSLFNVAFQAYGQEVEAFVCFLWFLT